MLDELTIEVDKNTTLFMDTDFCNTTLWLEGVQGVVTLNDYEAKQIRDFLLRRYPLEHDNLDRFEVNRLKMGDC